MSQVVYTELEGFPLRWEYKGAVPQETKKEADRTAKTWSVSTTPAAQVHNTNTGTANAVHGPNMVAQSFKSPNNATKVTSIQLYGNKVGSPSNPLYVEIRKVARNTKNTSNTESTDELIPRRGAICTAAQTVTVDWTTTGDKTLMTFTDTLPAGRKLIIFTLANASINAVGYLRIISGSTPLVTEQIMHIINGGRRHQPVMIFALHNNAPREAQYSLIATITTAGPSPTIIHVQGMVVWLGDSSAFFTTGNNTNIGANTTVNLATLNTNFAEGSKVVVLAYIIMGVTSTSESTRTYSAGNIRILRGSTIVSQTQFQTTTTRNTDPAIVALAYFDSNANANQSYAIQVYNNLNETSRAWGEIVAFQVSDGAFLDTGSVSLTNGSEVTVGNLSTTLSGDVGVVALSAAYYSGSFNMPQVFDINDVRLQRDNSTTNQVANQQPWYMGHNGKSGVYAFFRYDENVSNPSYQVKMTARFTDLSGEAKIVVFKLSKPSSAYISLTFNRYVAEIRLKIRRINNPSDITAKIYVSDVLMKTITLTNISTSYDIYTVSTGLEIEYTDDFKIELSYTAATTDDDYALKLAAGQPDNITVKKVADVILYFPNIKYYNPEPSETVLASGSIGAASVGTTAAWINISISTIALRPSTYYTLVVYTIGGDASNYYAIHTGGTGGTPGGGAEIFMSSTNSGSTWTMNNNTDLSFQLMGVQYTEIYSGTISNNVKHPLGGVILQLSIKAQTSGGMEFTAFDDHTLTAPVVSSSAASQTEIIILKPTDPRIRDVVEAPQLSWSIWAAGSGLSTRAYTQRYVYMTKNPITPADFGFSELYLVMDELPPKAHVALNDNVVAGLYNSSDTQIRIDSYELFRIPVRKAEVIAEPLSGKIVLYFIGLV